MVGSSYTSSQRNALQQFTALTQCSERSATKYLKQHQWNVQLAADSFYNSSSHIASPAPSRSITRLNDFFDSLRSPSDAPDTIGVDGSMTFLQSLGLSLEEPACMVLAEALSAPTMGEFSRKGFVDGWTAQGCDDLNKMKAKVPILRSSLDDPDTFKKVYLFTYGYAKSPGQKSLQLETAVECWKMLLPRWRLLDVWVAFLEKEYKKSIAKDTWNCLFDFVKLVERDPELATYDLDGAWPSILDDFVEYYRKQG